MDFVRSIIESDRLSGIINLPQNLRHSQVEIIILPVTDKETKDDMYLKEEPKKEKYRELYENPLKVKRIKSFSREELHL